MATARLMAIVILCAIPIPVSAQAWADAYRAGNYQKAADLLHVIVTDAGAQLMTDDPAPARHLAILYARGLGVARDAVAACGLARMADMSTHYMAGPRDVRDIPQYEKRLHDSQAFVDEHCGRLTDADRATALGFIGCHAFGMPEEVLPLGPFAVRVGRRGLELADADEPDVTELAGCAQSIAGVRARTIEPPPDAAPGVTPRYFVEVFAWTTSPPSPGYILQWDVYEVSPAGITPRAMEPLARYTRTRWPRPGLPSDLDARLTLEMIRSGHLRWRMDDDPPRRGWIMRPDEGAR